MAAPVELLRSVPLFAELGDRELKKIAATFKERQVEAGASVATEGEAGVGFFVVAEGEATVAVGGRQVGRLGPGDCFGEIALIDGGTRSATVTAVTPLRCYGLTSWAFKPLVEESPAIAWPLLQTLAWRLRTAEGRTI